MLGLCLLTAGTAIGATTQHFASASVSEGERAVLIPITPCRLADTRPAPNTVGPRSIGLGAADTHTIDAQQSDTACSGLIPEDASALSLNVTALGATEQSFLTIWAGGDRPTTASLNPAPGQPPVPNAVTTELSVDQEFQIYNNAGTVSVVVDVTGFYVDHDHDDRYYTKAESDSRYAANAGDQVFVGTADFRSGNDDWFYKDFVWLHEAGSGRDCLLAPLDIPAGSSVDSVDIRYNAATNIEIDILVGGISRAAMSAMPREDYLDFNLYRDDQAFAEQSEDDIGLVNVVTGIAPNEATIKPVAAGHDTLLEICTSSAVAILSATVNLG